MNLHKQLLSLLLILAIAFPSPLFAQSQLDMSKLPTQIRAYTNKPIEVNVANGSRLPLLLIETDTLAGSNNPAPKMPAGFLSTAVGVFGFIAGLLFLPNLRTFSEHRILTTPDLLQKYIKIRYNPEIVQGGKSHPILAQFKNLDLLFKRIERANNYHIMGQFPFEAFGAREFGGATKKNFTIVRFYTTFDRLAGITLEKYQVLELIDCLQFAENPGILLNEDHYPNVVKVLKKYGRDTTAQMMFQFREQAFNDFNFEKILTAIGKSRAAYPDMTDTDHVKYALDERTLDRFEPEKSEFLSKIHQKSSKYKLRRIGWALGIGLAAGGLIYLALSAENEKEPVELEKLGASVEEALEKSDEDREAFIHALNSDEIFAAVVSWLCDQIVQSGRDIKFLIEAAAEFPDV